MAAPNQPPKIRDVPENGHVLLLLELVRDQRTFRDYPDLVTCLADLDQMYEERRQADELGTENYELPELWSWLDGFHRIELYVYDKEISRYKRVSREEIKATYVNVIEKIGVPVENKTISNPTQPDDYSDPDELDWES